MDFKVIAYLTYIIISLGLTVWVGRTLHKHGRSFLLDIFAQDHLLTDSINKLLLIGFYLVNLGYILYNLITRLKIENAIDAIELLSVKVGMIVIVLGIMHFANIFILFKMRAKNKRIVREII